MKKKSVLLSMILVSCNVIAQTNYTTGNMSNCYTWARWADQYKTIDNLNIISGSTVSLDISNVHGSTITLNDNGAIVLNSNAIILDGVPNTDIRCGGIYGYDNGYGKYTYSASTCDLVNGIFSASVTFGPIKRTGNYNFNRVKVIFFTLIDGGNWTTDWDIHVHLNVNGGAWSREQTVSTWYNRGSIQDRYGSQTVAASSTCGRTLGGFGLEETFSWDFTSAYPAIYLVEGQYVTIEAYLSPKTNPAKYLSELRLLLDLRITEQ